MTSLPQFLNNTTSDSATDPLQKSLSTLWSKIEKKQKRNQKFRDDKEKLFTEFQTHVLPIEQQQGIELANLVEFLIPFLTRKSLSDYQRDELIGWIESTLDYLRSHPFLEDVDHDALQTKFNDAFVTYTQSQMTEIQQEDIEGVRTEIEHMFDGHLQLSDEEIIALMKDPSLLNQHIHSVNEMFEEEQAESMHSDPFEDCIEDDFEGDFEGNEFEHATVADAKQKNLDKLFKAGQLNKIYKRLASILHPDKEQDPDKKAEKQRLMQTLSAARKNKDAFTLIQLYQTHINDGKFGFDNDTLSSMQILLREKLARLDDELYEDKSNNELPTLVWRKFSGRSKTQTKNNIKLHVSTLLEEMQDNQLVMQQNKTVAQMKKVLQERIEESRGWVSDMPIDLMDLFK